MASNGTSPGGGGPPRTVLLIDPDPHLRTVLGDRLRHEGFAVAAAADEPEGLRMLLSSMPSAVILGLSARLERSLNFLKQISDERLRPRLPVLLLAAIPIGEEALQGVTVDGLLTKPVSGTRVVAHLKEILVRRATAAGRRRRGLVLIVEADAEKAEALAAELTDAGFSASLTDQGLDLFARVAQDAPDVVAINENLPRVRGSVVVGLARSMHATRTIPVVLYGAGAKLFDASGGAMPARPDSVVTGDTPADIVAAVRTLMNRLEP